MSNSIPFYKRFQWIQNEQVVEILASLFPYRGVGRRGYDKVCLFIWLMYRQITRCTYRDLEGFTGIDHSTFVKFRQKLMRCGWFERVHEALIDTILPYLEKMHLVVDSSSIPSYSRKQEEEIEV